MIEVLAKIKKSKKSKKVKSSDNSLFQGYGIKEAHEKNHSYIVYVYGTQSIVKINRR